MSRPLFLLTFCYSLGIILARLSFLHWFQALLISLLLVLLTVRLLKGHETLHFPNNPITKISLLLFIAILGYLHFALGQNWLPSNHISHSLTGKKIEIVGEIARMPMTYGRGERLYIQANEVISDGISEKVTGLVRISIYRFKSGAQYGDTVKISRLKPYVPSNFNNPDGFDYKKMMRDRGIYVLGSLNKKSQIKIVKKNNRITPYRLISDLKLQLISFIDKHVSRRESRLLKTIVFGEKRAITLDERDKFNRAGTSHILAVSGLHVGFVALFFYYLWHHFFINLFSKFFRRYLLMGYSSKFAAFLTIPPVIVYMVMAGSAPASFRATIMTCVYLASVIMGREREILSSMLLAALILIVKDPPILFNIGFQFSFTALFSIIYGYQKIWGESPDQPKLYERKAVNNLINKSIKWGSVSVLATVGTLPLTLYYFNMVSVIGPLSNITAIPLIGIIVPATLIISTLSLFWNSAASLLTEIPESLCSLLLYLTESANRIPMSYLRLGTPSIWAVFAYYCLLAGLFSYKKNRGWKILSFVSTVLLIISLTLPTIIRDRKENGYLTVIFLDVGQGGAVFVRFPSGRNMLIDSGGAFGDFNIGRMVVGPYLWDRGITHLDYVIGTHSDRDHIGGLTYILKEFKVGEYIDNGDNKEEWTQRTVRKIVSEQEIPYRSVSIGDRLVPDNSALVEFLNPVDKQNFSNKKQTDNYRSIVSRISFKDFSILITSDIDKQAERNIIKSGIKIKSNIMEAPHHGSKNSSSSLFIKSVSPDASMVSVGKRNPFRHPHPKTLERYAKQKIKIYRTDIHGAITIKSDGRGYSIKTFL